MTSHSDDVPGAAPTPLAGKVEYQLRGEPEALRRLREVLEGAGVFIQVDHEYRDTTWKDNGLVIGAFLVPAAERVGDLEGADRG